MSNITIKDYLTASGTYPDRETHKEVNSELIKNAEILLKKVNELLKFLNFKGTVKVSSGFRPSDVNSKIANAAKKSAHMTGEAIDLLDDSNQTLCKLITKEILEKFDLYREDSDATKGKVTNWCHLQTRKTSSGNRIFKP